MDDVDDLRLYSDVPIEVNRLARRVNGVAIEVHKMLGPGMYERTYQLVLAHELARRGYRVEVERPVPLRIGALHIDVAFRADLVVEDTYVVELKVVDEILPAHVAQLKTYLRIGGWPLGFVLNFNAEKLYLGMKRVVP